MSQLDTHDTKSMTGDIVAIPLGRMVTLSSFKTETVMTIQFSRQAIAAVSVSLPTTGSGLVRRLVQARNDPGKKRIRMWLLDLDDAQLRSGLGLTPENIAVLRTGTGV
jgi:hypothetical protein